MKGPCMIGLLPLGEAVYTNPANSLDDQKAEALEWMGQCESLKSVHAVVNGTISDITAAYCRMWFNKTDLSDYERDSDFPMLVRFTVPELIDELMSDRAENARGSAQLAADYRAGAL
jgi:hypothetical protein